MILLAVAGVIFFFVVVGRRRKGRRNASTDALSAVVESASTKGAPRWRPQCWKGEWWL